MHLLFEFEKETKEELFSTYAPTIIGFKQWVRDRMAQQQGEESTVLPAKMSTEQNIALSFFKLANYSKVYWRSLLVDTPLSLSDNLIFLMNLAVHGEMTKMELIRKSAQEKPTGMQIVNRLIELKLVNQKDSEVDKRSKIVEITALGQQELVNNMEDIQKVSQVINGNLKHTEQQSLVQLLDRLMQFHDVVFSETKSREDLICFIASHEK